MQTAELAFCRTAADSVPVLSVTLSIFCSRCTLPLVRKSWRGFLAKPSKVWRTVRLPKDPYDFDMSRVMPWIVQRAAGQRSRKEFQLRAASRVFPTIFPCLVASLVLAGIEGLVIDTTGLSKKRPLFVKLFAAHLTRLSSLALKGCNVLLRKEGKGG